MQRRVTLTKLLSFIDEASVKILEYCTNLRKEVKESGLFVDDLVSVFPKVSRETILKEIDEKIASYESPSLTIKKELDLFVSALDDGCVEDDESNTFSYMREVWLGDIYGVSGIEALKTLAKELKHRAENELNIDELIKALAASIELKK